MEKYVSMPIIFLTIIGLIIFLTESREKGFVPGGLYSGVSVHGLLLSKNLTNDENPLFMYMSRQLEDGKIVYDAYNRFPVFPFLVVGLLILPFDNDLFFQNYLARQLMNLFFFLALIITYKTVRDLVGNNYLALSVVFTCFSSFYMLSYNNMVFNDIPALFGFSISLNAVVVLQKKSLKASHFLYYSILPICLGWQPYSVYFIWIITDFIEVIFSTDEVTLNKKFLIFIKKPSIQITTVAILIGIFILLCQVFYEWEMVGGTFSNLPSISSVLWRTGFSSASGHTQYVWAFEWLNFLPGQAQAITIMSIPFWPIFQINPGINASIFFVVIILLNTVIKYLKEKNFNNKFHVILIFSGIFWALVMRHFVALHDFQSIFYFGFSISVFTLLLLNISSRSWSLLSVNITIAFIIAISSSNYFKSPNVEMNQLTNQFQVINNILPKNSKVFYDGDRHKVISNIRYALDLMMCDYIFTKLEEAEYVISKDCNYKGSRLTNNKSYNLYRIN